VLGVRRKRGASKAYTPLPLTNLQPSATCVKSNVQLLLPSTPFSDSIEHPPSLVQSLSRTGPDQPPFAMPFTSYQTTPLGWFVRQITGRTVLRYPDEIAHHKSEPSRYAKASKLNGYEEKFSQERKKGRSDLQRRQQRTTDSIESQKTCVQKKGGGGIEKGGGVVGDSEEKGKDPNLVQWNGPDDPENPRNVRSSTIIRSLESMPTCL
jgi:hypothetical protein